MKKKKHISFVLGSLGRGGAERVISILSNDYVKEGWDVDIILLLFYKIDYDINPNIRVIDFTGNSNSRVKRIHFWLKKLRQYSKENRPDVMLAFSARINLLVQIACKKYTKKLFVSERNDPKEDGRSVLVRMATKVLYKKADGVIFQTQRAKSYFKDLSNGVVIANPIAVENFAQKNKSKKIVTVGRLTKQKNQKLLLNSFANIANDYPKYILEIYGCGELLNDLQKHAEVLGISNKVFFKGNVKNIHKCISDSELFVLSSNYEGLSNALLEAMMMGLPCISTNCAGSDEYIINENNGLLVPVGNEFALTDAIRRMLANETLRTNCGNMAAKAANLYSKESILKKWHDLMD